MDNSITVADTRATISAPKTAILRRAISDRLDRPVLVLDAHNVMAAHVVENRGADACWVGSFAVSAANGLFDNSDINLTDMLEPARRIDSATSLPVIVDIDNGYGSPDAVARAARELTHIGIAGICIQDSRHPKKSSLRLHTGNQMQEPQEFGRNVQLLRASALNDLVIIARTEELIVGGSIDSAIHRALVAVEAGADLALIHSIRPDGSQAIEVAQRWPSPTPLAVVPTRFPQLKWVQLGKLGYRLVIYANQLSRAVLRAEEHAAAELIADKADRLDTQVASVEEVFSLLPTPR